MADAPLATPADAAAYGKGTLTETALRTASVRARGYTKQTISAGTSTVQATGPSVRLPQRPARKIISVTDTAGNPVPHRLRNGRLDLGTAGDVSITYEHGFTELPDHLIETICTIAARLDALSPALAGGLQQATVGGETQGFGWDSHQGVGGLVASERQALDRAFPARPSMIVLRP